MEESNKMKYIYKKRDKGHYFASKKSLTNSNTIKDFFKNYLSYETTEEFQSIFTPNNYIQIYNYLFLITNNQEFIEIYSFINEELITLINNKIKSEEENQNEIGKIMNIISYIDIIGKKIKNIKNLLTTCVSRFNTELIKSMNDKLNVFSILIQTNNDFNDFIDKSKQVFLNYLSKNNDETENQKIINSIFQFIKIISNQKNIDSFYENIFNLVIQKGKYMKLYEEFLTKLNELNNNNIINDNLISNYFDSINKEVEIDYIFFQKAFGENEANKFKDKIIQIYLFDKFIKDIFQNEKLLKIIILEEKYDILKFIESKTRHSLKLTKDFVNSVFSVLLKEYEAQIVMPTQRKDISQGLKFIDQMLLKIKSLNHIFKEVFNENRKVHLKFHETLLKLISSKNFEALEYFLSIYVNENIYKENIRNNMLLDKSFLQLLTNRNNKEVFFNYYKTYIIKRISNNKFNLDIELSFEKYLKSNIENRYMIHINRLFQDIEDNKFINNDNSPNYFYLFSYEALDDQYDLIQIIDFSKISNDLNPFKQHMDKYNEQYPKRKIVLSQILSNIEVIFLNKYNLLVNYVQWYILQIISKQKDYSLTYGQLSSLIPYKAENKIFLKEYLNSLIEMKILIKESKSEENKDINIDDILKINLNFQINNKKDIICFTKPNSIIKGMIKKMNSLENDKNEKEKNEYNKNYRTNAIKDNARHIIDSIIIQIIKALPRGERISEKELVINTIKHKLIADLHLNKYNVVDPQFIKQRISTLVERNFIQIHNDEANLTYSYC